MKIWLSPGLARGGVTPIAETRELGTAKLRYGQGLLGKWGHTLLYRNRRGNAAGTPPPGFEHRSKVVCVPTSVKLGRQVHRGRRGWAFSDP